MKVKNSIKKSCVEFGSMSAKIFILFLCILAQVSIRGEPKKSYLINTNKCKIPNYDAFNDEILGIWHPQFYKSCSSRPLLTYITKTDREATLNIRQDYLPLYGKNITCCVSNVVRDATGLSPDDKIRRILPKSSKIGIDSAKKEPMDENSNSNSITDVSTELDPTSSSSATNIKSLEDQIHNLKTVVSNLKEDIENKENGIAKLAREKEKLSLDLAKQKKSNSNILKQLEDERKFYFEEKEIYCHEMNEMKEFKKSLSRSNTSINEKSAQELKNEIDTLKHRLKQTLEANYNLSIKFLRIKNTKAFLRNELIKMKIEHEKIFNDLKSKIEAMSAEIENIADNKAHLYASPSNRKYVQLVRQNSSLVHENLCLQMEIDRLNSQFDKIKLKYTKSETNNRLKYAHSLKSDSQVSCKHNKREKKVRITDDKTSGTEEKNNNSNRSKSNTKTTKAQSEIIKIFERSESSDTPCIHIINEEVMKRHHHKKHRKSCKKHSSKANFGDFIADSKKDAISRKENFTHKPCTVKLASIAEIDENENTINKNFQSLPVAN